jgi:hypothetical protein
MVLANPSNFKWQIKNQLPRYSTRNLSRQEYSKLNEMEDFSLNERRQAA